MPTCKFCKFPALFHPMGLGKKLTDYEKGKIDAYKSAGNSVSKIAEILGRSRNVVSNYVNNPSSYGIKSSPGRPKAVGRRTENKIIALASNKTISSNEIKHQIGLDVSSRTVRRCLGSCEFLKYSKLMPKPPLTDDHKLARLEFARSHHTWSEKWDYVFFSDEKKFNLDGPDGFQYYWHDLRKEKKTFSKRVQGGGSVMIWAFFSKHLKGPIVFISTRMNSKIYQELLRDHLLPAIENIGREKVIFQQDNAPCHRSISTKEWLAEHGIECMEWPSRSPDLNPIENLWGILVRAVYAGGRQFQTVADLKATIIEKWREISPGIQVKLVDSMKDRMFDVIFNHGGQTKY